MPPARLSYHSWTGTLEWRDQHRDIRHQPRITLRIAAQLFDAHLCGLEIPREMLELHIGRVAQEEFPHQIALLVLQIGVGISPWPGLRQDRKSTRLNSSH